VVNPVGKGKVLWMPHQLLQSAGSAALNRYYAAIAAALQTPLVSLSQAPAVAVPTATTTTAAGSRPAINSGGAANIATAAASAPTGAAMGGTGTVDNVQCALRRTARGSYLLGLFNRGSEPARVIAAIDGVAGVALDLSNETELPLEVEGNSSQLTVEIAAGSYCLVALSASRATLDAERDTPLLHVKLS
jgi:hypothetical protein